jgi:hypothetical protein
LLVVVVVAFTYVLMSRLPLATRQTAAKREYNAKVLNQAKQALIGKMVIDAAGTDDNPGRLRCPEGVNNIGTDQEGVAAPDPGDPTCARVGRLPWRTLGLDKLVDADAEPLWYAVSPGWSLQNTSTLLDINSDKRGQMTVDGQAPPNDVVALIIAPGRRMNVQAAPGCTARNQARAAPAPTIDPADYIECFNAATPAFSTVGPAASFNDQALAVTTADLIPPLEAAIQQRMQREIAPALRTVYASAAWGQTAGNPVYPFAARFDNPDPGSGNAYQGEDGRYQGLMPFNCSAAGCASDSRYAPTFVNWSGGGGSPSMSVAGSLAWGGGCNIVGNQVQCTGTYVAVGTATFTVTVRATNVAMALRRLDPSGVTLLTGSLLSLGTCSVNGTVNGISAAFLNDGSGSATLTIQAQAPGLLGPPPVLLPLTVQFCITVQLGALADHSLLDPNSTGAGSTGWFVRNEWYRLVWYAAAPMNTADNLNAGSVPTGCVNNPPITQNCLRFNGTRTIRALLLLAGRSLSNPANRPNNNLRDYLEGVNCNKTFVFPSFVCNPGPNQAFEQRAMRMDKVEVSPPGSPFYAPFNDRLVLVDWIAPAPTFPIATLLP